MIYLRSAIFAAAFYTLTAVLTLLFSPSLLLPFPVVYFFKQAWLRPVVWLIRSVLGIAMETRGTENLPDGPVILAAKHQSAWDTMGLSLLHADAAFVLKRELTWIPVFGWYLARMGMIPIDRSRGVSALKTMAAVAKERIAEGRSVLIFPQGTRTPPGGYRPYLAGVAALYGALDVPVVPVALNSGLFWPRRRFVKWPGTITVEYLEPIQPGLDRKTFMKTLEARIEPATTRLEVEARTRFPYLPTLAESHAGERAATGRAKA